jgi:DNA-binding FrmR family transcriptional regulator
MTADKKSLVRRLKIIEGQVRGMQEMVMKDTYCIDVITQASAVKQGISNVEDVLLEHHLGHCLVNQIKAGRSAEATAEIIKVYRLKRK